MEYEKKCPELPPQLNEKERPDAAMYFRIFGYKHGMMSDKWDNTKEYKNTDAVYAECLKRHCTWQELLDFHGYPEGVLY